MARPSKLYTPDQKELFPWFVYVNWCKDRPGFEAKLEFLISLLSQERNTDWIEGTVLKDKGVLDQDRAPEHESGCLYCSFVAQGSQMP